MISTNHTAQISPNRWSCLPVAFCNLLGIPLQEMLNGIGHDGSKIIDWFCPEPYNRQAFHPQEIIDWLWWEKQLAVTEIEKKPLLGSDLHVEQICPIDYPEERFLQYRELFDGVIVGQHKGLPHATTWKNLRFICPNGNPIDEKQYEMWSFYIVTSFQGKSSR